MAAPERRGYRAAGAPAPRYLTAPASVADRLKSLPLYLLPHHALSRLVHRVTRVRARWLRVSLIRAFIGWFRVDMSEAEAPDPEAYPHFNAFFTRALRADARPLPEDIRVLCSPVDGAVSALGPIHDDTLLQAKGRTYPLTSLLGGCPERAAPFRGGSFLTLYLAPRDYHRVHMPLDGTLREMVHVPGQLFSVGRHTVRTIPGLFVRNERVACCFDTAIGPFAVVLVGAINVGSIETVWAGEITPPRARRTQRRTYPDGSVRLARGDELGRFNMGSTVILLAPPGAVAWDERLDVDQLIRARTALGRF